MTFILTILTAETTNTSQLNRKDAHTPPSSQNDIPPIEEITEEGMSAAISTSGNKAPCKCLLLETERNSCKYVTTIV